MGILSTNKKIINLGQGYSAGNGISIDNYVISYTGDKGQAYNAGPNIDIYTDQNQLYISGKDWSADIANASSNAFEQATALIPPEFDPSYISGVVDNKLDSTAFSTVSGDYATTSYVDMSDDLTYSRATAWAGQNLAPLNSVANNSAKWNEIEVYEQNSASYLTSHQDISNKLDTTAFSTVSGTFLTAHQSLDGYLTKSSADTLYQPIGSYASQSDLEQVSGDLKGEIDYISGVAITALPGDIATTGDISDLAQSISETYQPIGDYLTNADSANFYPMTGNPSGFITGVDLSNYYTKSQTSGATELADAFANIPAGDADVNAYVQGNSATIDNVNSTVQTNSAQWAQGGGSIDTIPVVAISPLVTGFSGESAYLGIESSALNLSSYVPVSAIGVDRDCGWVNKISGRDISAYNAATAYYAYTANRSYLDRNGNEITSYYQPKLTIAGDNGTITAINNSAVGASIPEGWELIAGAGIEIVDDDLNNQTTINVTAQGGNPEVENYVQSNSATIDDVNLTVQTNSGSWAGGTSLTGDAQGAVDEVYSHSADWDDTTNCVQTNSASWTGGGGSVTGEYVPLSATDVAIGSNVSAYENSIIQGNLGTAHSGSIAQGYDNFASGYSFAQGCSNTSISGSIAQGYQSYASGYSIAQGRNNIAQHGSQAFGLNTFANYYGMAIGKYNKISTAAFVVGDGTSTTKKDTFIINHNGSVSAAGNISANGIKLGVTGDGQGAATTVYNNSANWIRSYDTVNSNSSFWGGQSIQISAGEGISISLVDNVLLISTASV